MQKLDLKKDLKHLYSPSKSQVSDVDVPAFNFLMVDGKGTPDGKEAVEAIQALYPVAYKLKFMFKFKDKDFAVMPLEGLWWAEDMNEFVKGNKEKWLWTYIIMQPDFVTKKDFKEALDEVKKKKDSPGLSKIRFEKYKEGKAAQILHIGSYSEETENIKKIHEHIHELGGKFDGHKQKHHEIYLSDPRKTSIEKLKTVVRQPYTM